MLQIHAQICINAYYTHKQTYIQTCAYTHTHTSAHAEREKERERSTYTNFCLAGNGPLKVLITESFSKTAAATQQKTKRK